MKTVCVKTGEVVHVSIDDEGRAECVLMQFENSVSELQYLIALEPEEAVLLAAHMLMTAIECIMVRKG